MVEQIDRTRHPLDSIASKFDPDPNPDSQQADVIENQSPVPALSPQSIQSPVLLFDRKLRVVWRNKTAGTHIWHDTSSAHNGSEAANIFDLIFSSHFQKRVHNWRQWAAFFLEQAYTLVAGDDLDNLIAQRDQPQRQVLQAILADFQSPPQRSAYSSRLRLIHADGMAMTYWVVALNFDQGRLLVFEPSSEKRQETTTLKGDDVESAMELVGQHNQPVKLSFYVLSTRLDKADTIRTEMLADEYSRLLNRLCHKSIEIIEQHGGIFGQNPGHGLLGYFLPANEAANNPLRVIDCALELKSQMVELGREWKIRKGWLHDIELNIGISSGNEYVGTVHSSFGDNLLTFGDSLQFATCLSELANNGQIWTTKDLINQIPQKELRHLRFGIFRDDNLRKIFIAKCFSRIKDLSGIAELSVDISGDIGTLAVTQIFDRQK